MGVSSFQQLTELLTFSVDNSVVNSL